MRLADILTVERVTVDLRAASKAAALRAMADLFVRTDERLDAHVIARVFEEREALASTGVGSGVAIPHGRMKQVTSLQAAMAICKGGVEFDAIDGRPATIVIAVLGPEQKTGDHLKALARFSRLLRHASVRDRLLAAGDDAEALRILVEEDERK